MSAQTHSSLMKIVQEHQMTIPVNVNAIAQALGLVVIVENGWKDDRLSGKIVRVNKDMASSGYAIYVNGKHSLQRQRFTIAHEIAHFILHKELIGDGISDDALYRSGLSNAQEFMANKTAADILMPWHFVNRRLKEGIDSVEGMAREFDVSGSAMSIRLGVPASDKE